MGDVLIIEDEQVLARSLMRALKSAGHEARVASTGLEGAEAVRASVPDLVLLDLRLPDGSGLDVLAELHGIDPSISIVLMTAYGSVQDAVEAMRRGAVDYLQKPLDLDEVQILVDRLLERQQRDRELEHMRRQDVVQPSGVIGTSPGLRAIFEQIARLADVDLDPGKRPTILLTGETGTGKGTVARAVHSLLGPGPFVEVNCTALPASLVESELFGYERGTFTDARTSRAGLFEAASGGAIFLDEIGHLELAVQTKFLKVIEEKRVRRLGSSRDREVDVHVIAATNLSLDEAVERGEFREDLLYRLSVLSFEIAPLRERRADIPLLARHFVSELGAQYGRPEATISDEATAILEGYAWPGNVRELRNVIERAVLLSPNNELDVDLFAGLLRAGQSGAKTSEFELPANGVDLEAVERDLIRQALDRTQGNRTQAAALLGLTRDTLRYRVEKFGLG